jgi:prepilin-type N-terminal cleavage/methylation domain-containing protein
MKTPAGRGSQGYSLIEVMVVIVITTVGFIALINLQIGTLRAVGMSRAMMQGVNLAEHFIETLKVEALPWNMDASSMISQPDRFPNLRLAGNAVAGGSSGWIRGMLPAGSDRRIGPLGTGEGDDTGIASEIVPDRDRRYCLHFRLTWVVPEYLMRADVRVLWMRDEARLTNYEECPIGMETDLANVASVTVPGTVIRNVFMR